MRSEDARLHPVSILVGVPLLQLVRGLVLPAFAVLAGGRGGDLTPVLLLGVVLVGLIVRVLIWQRFRWSFDGVRLEVAQGVLGRTRRVVDVARVQQVELDRPLLQRLLGVATVRVDTAGTDAAPEVELRVLALDDALALRAALQPPVGVPDAGPGSAAQATDGTGPTVVLRVPLRRVALAAVTGAQLLVAPAALIGLVQLAGDRGETFVEGSLERFVTQVGAGAAPDVRTWSVGVLVAMALTIVTAAVLAVVRDGRFVVLHTGDDLVLRRGLLGTRESIVPLRRVQVVRVSANPLRRALGVATLRIHSAGGASGPSQGGDRRVVVPLIGADEMAPVLAEVLPVLGDGGLPPLVAHPTAARRRILWRRLRGLAVLAGPLAAAWAVLATRPSTRAGLPFALPDAVVGLADRDGAAWAVPLGATVLLVLLQTLLARVEHAALGHGVDARVIAARAGVLARTLSVAPLGRLQGVTEQRSWFQDRRGLATLRAHVAGPGGDVVVPDVGADDADRLRARLADAAAGGMAHAERVRPRAAL